MGSVAGADLPAYPGLDDPHLDVIPRTADEVARIAAVTTPTTDFTQAQPFEERSAGAATVRARADANAFSLPSGNITFEDELQFKLGNGLFRKLWVSSPSSTLASDGLGPLFNARSCQRCHIKDGRGHPPETAADNAVSMFLRVSVMDPDGVPDDANLAQIADYIATLPDPTYGTQLQDVAVQGHPAEYTLGIDYEEQPVTLADGTEVSLRAPTYRADNLGYGPLAEGAMLSPRVAPQMIGLGLLEAIPAADILAGADPDDLDGDGISGRPNIVWSHEFDRPMLGRFGLKAGNPTIMEQSSSAFVGDIGISNPLFPAASGECTDLQADCQAAIHGDGDARGTEIDAEGMALVTFYSRNLGVPARRDVDNPEVLRGKEVFYTTGCTACHRPSFVTHRLENQPEQSFQLIWPYTDMLLHDMGPGLADNRPEARATGQEWRTPPLWGIGLTEQVSGHSYFLHDGRARSLLEAILWHGGEAQAQRDAVIDMPSEDRAALLRFLESL
ncbi:di-heme oxidoredictase family protein [Thalassorhabdomicrobium marinisediminis]|uniref:Thiol oxidoreductase n=1 Tax=Thalassorhabdomicrobium marinisediminis TaxID=2170577 RepID=A0A2T7FT44_9RHOB|nr:di-heme oxidoredictase family protein [Thalassorhabdomicrobium marinisediminis]PVA05339.1 thiol oxidoreductase [Thalassorhabdomicrobium marinisediminis]